MTKEIQVVLQGLSKIDFSGRGESYVESKFLFPLLEQLGYQQHKDYDVRVHGDDGSSLKLKYPPVEAGAKPVKHYSPDYIPTIRRKSFWVIEAKSAKDLTWPFAYKYLVQGLQYSIHPEVQAELLVLSNGADTAIYEPYKAAFLEGSFYDPVLHFRNTEILEKWPEIFELLSVEKVRVRVESLLIAHYEKLAESSLDKDYPKQLWERLGRRRIEISRKVEKHLNKLRVEALDDSLQESQLVLESMSPSEIHNTMFKLPIGVGKSASIYYVDKQRAALSDGGIFSELVGDDYERTSIFHKEHVFVALAYLWQVTSEPLKSVIYDWLTKRQDGILNRLNRNETALLRITRKIMIILMYPEIRAAINSSLEHSPEIVRFVSRLGTLDITYKAELVIHNKQFMLLREKTDDQLDEEHIQMEKFEHAIEAKFLEAYNKLAADERQINGFEGYGIGGRHYAFKSILKNFKIIP